MRVLFLRSKPVDSAHTQGGEEAGIRFHLLRRGVSKNLGTFKTTICVLKKRRGV